MELQVAFLTGDISLSVGLLSTLTNKVNVNKRADANCSSITFVIT